MIKLIKINDINNNDNYLFYYNFFIRSFKMIINKILTNSFNFQINYSENVKIIKFLEKYEKIFSPFLKFIKTL